MNYDCISIDTSIFVKYRLLLDQGMLGQLYQFRGAPDTFILSDIVVREVLAKLTEAAGKSKSDITSALQEGVRTLGLKKHNVHSFMIDNIPTEDDFEIAQLRMGEFLESSSTTIVETSTEVGILKNIIDAYFSNSPPFGNSKKKNEFPDAIALHSIEAWAKKSNKRIICVSADNDWVKYAETSKYLFVTPDLSEALSYFQPKNDATDVVENLKKMLPLGTPVQLYSEIEERLRTRLSELKIKAEFSEIPYLYQIDVYKVSVELKSFSFPHDSIGRPNIFLIAQGVLGFSLHMTLKVEASLSCSFSAFAYDGASDSHYPVTETIAKTENVLFIDTMVTIDGRNGVLERLHLSDLRITEWPSSVLFGKLADFF